MTTTATNSAAAATALSSPPLPPSPPPTAPPTKQKDTALLESLARITLAGLGGALAGLSVAKRRGTFGASTDAILGRRAGDVARIEEALRSSSPSLRLPTTWAVGCVTFAGIVEFSSLVSPTALLLDGLREMGVLGGSADDDDGCGWMASVAGRITGGGVGSDSVGSERDVSLPSTGDSKILFWDEKSTQTLGDFALGGAIAGAIFKGNSIGTSLPNSDVATGSGSRGGAASYKMASSMVNKNIPSTGNYKQKQTIGRGRVITLATKNASRLKRDAKVSSSLLQASGNIGGRILKNVSGSGMVPPILKPRTGIMVGLLPGLALGLVAGLVQILLNRLDATVTDMKLSQLKEEEGNGEDKVEQNTVSTKNKIDEEAFETRVKQMTTAEIQREIDALKSRAAS